jgi:hypothetical protein
MKVSIEVLATDTNSKAFLSVIVQNSVSCFLAGYSWRQNRITAFHNERVSSLTFNIVAFVAFQSNCFK